MAAASSQAYAGEIVPAAIPAPMASAVTAKNNALICGSLCLVWPVGTVAAATLTRVTCCAHLFSEPAELVDRRAIRLLASYRTTIIRTMNRLMNATRLPANGGIASSLSSHLG